MSAPSAQAAPSTPRRLRIAVLNRVFAPTGGGAERYSIALVEALAQRHEVHVYAQQIGHTWPGVHYHRVSMPMRKPRWLNQLWYATATWWATRHGFDVVHSHENTWHGQVQTVHVLPVWHTLFQGRTGLRRLLRWARVLTSPRLLTYLGLEARRLAPRPGRQVVVTSDSLRDTVAQVFPHLAGQLAVLTPGVQMPLPTSAADRVAARQRLGLPANARCLLFVGNDYRKKGLATLLTALAQLPPEVGLVVVGQRTQQPEYEARAQALGLRGRVWFLGPLPDVGPAYQAADLLVHPTLEDTFAMVVLEAMAHGLPVVVSGSAHCGIASLLVHGEQAWLLPDPQDPPALVQALQALLGPGDTVSAVARQLAEQGRAWAAEHDWAHIAQAQERLYLQACAPR